MEPFTTAFFNIDKNGDEKITIADLERYVDENKMDRTMISHWEDLFDKNHTGVITLEEFCDKLGLKLAEVRVQHESFRVQQAKPTERIRVIQATMPTDEQDILAEEVYRLTSDPNRDPKDIADYLKKFLEQKYGRIWDVVIMEGSCWSSFSHIPKTSIFFQYKKCLYLIWKTPAES